MNVAVMGFGVVGSGVAELIAENRGGIIQRSGIDLEITRILDKREFADSPYSSCLTSDINDIVNDSSIDIVIECMGGLHPAFEFVSACLSSGKSVVTSNKVLVSAKGSELFEIAAENSVNFMFEASVGGGIPIIRPMSRCLVANEISDIAGILNGTTNFILTKMIVDKLGFDEALALAQKNGYAEADPTADIEGFDAARKICILASLAFGSHVYPDEVYTEGITKITGADTQYAKSCGGVIKLISDAKRLDGNRIVLATAPAVVSSTSQLAGVADVYNAVLVRGNATGDVLFYGKGAGKLATASAVVADAVDCAIHLERRKIISWGPHGALTAVPYDDVEQQFMVRVTSNDRTKALTKINCEFCGVRELTRPDAPVDELAFVTAKLPKRVLEAKLAALPIVVESIIRLTDY